MATIDDKDVEMKGHSVTELNAEISASDGKDDGNRDDMEMAYYGKKQQLKVSKHSMMPSTLH
jgi:hypothetical protein